MIAEERALVEGVIAELKRLGEDKPWKSVGVLARRRNVPASYLRTVLLDYVRSKPWDELEIRYSQYPSKRNLDLIWAHTDRVGHRRLPEIAKYDDEFTAYDPELEGRPCVFISHSHADFERGLYIREHLILLQLNAWLSEIDILRNQDIFAAIAEGLASCRALLVDITARSVQSVWVQKEFMGAVQERRRAFVLIDGADGRLLAQLEKDLDPASEIPLPPTTMYPEFIAFVRSYIEQGRPVFAFPFTDATLLGTPLLPLRELPPML